jgi:VWFA-related protein
VIRVAFLVAAGVLAMSADFTASPTSVQAQDAPRPAFRAGTHAVAVDVAVFDGDRVVTSLGPSDFEILDNGVRQTISAVDSNLLPIDLRLVFDTSGSIRATDLEKYRRAMARVTAVLRPDDRCEIFTFSKHIADAARRQHPPVKITVQRPGADGTAFFDAVSLAMITIPALDRRHITIVLSDAEDNASFFDEETLVSAARRTDAVVYTILPPGVAPGDTPATARLKMLSLMTGGRLVRAQQDREMGNFIIDALEEFRQSYVVRYTLNGVPPEGWHRLTVNVRGSKNYTLRARDGYFGR